MKSVLLIILMLLLGCQNKDWTTDEQVRFNIDCVEAGQTTEYCQCLLQCLLHSHKIGIFLSWGL